MSEELLQLVDGAGRPTGTAPRRACHGEPRLLHAVVHLYLFDEEGRLYLQRRAAGKALYPGRWDTSVGGHLVPGETPEQALRREAHEELGLVLRRAPAGALSHLPPYIYRDCSESEYVFPFRLVYSTGRYGPLRPNPEELQGGAFFSLSQIRRLIEREPAAFTPHFRFAFGEFLDAGQGG